jgi:ABC-type nitrate/sulfonate/bicarbonate transport system substrate-binding protein
MDRRRFLNNAAYVGAGALAAVAAPRIGRAQSSMKSLRLITSTVPPDPGCHYLYYARENGFFEQEGVKVKFLELPTESTAIRALVAGEGEVAWAGGLASLAAAGSGSKLKAIAAPAPRVDYFIVAKKDTVPDMKALAGKVIGISAPGSISQVIPLRMMEKYNVPTKGVQWTPLGNSVSRLQGLIAKRLDAAALNSSFAYNAVKHDYLHIVGDAFKDLPLQLQLWDTATEAAIAGNPDGVQGYVTAAIRGVRWGMANPKEAGLISAKLMPDVPEQQMLDGIKDFANRHFWNANGDLSREAYDFTTSWMVTNHQIPKVPTYDSFYVPKFVDAAIAKLGRVAS